MWIEVIPVYIDEDNRISPKLNLRFVQKLTSNDSIAELLATASIQTSNAGVQLSDPNFRFTIQFKPIIEGYHDA